MKKFYKLLFFIFITGSAAAQQDRVLGTPYKYDTYIQKSQPPTIANGNGTIATSYTTTACGLDFTQASVRLHKRTFTALTPQTGVNQPATFSISGIPACATIIKAFLYSSTSGNGISVTANITNPVATNSNFPMSIIGTAIDKCWGYVASYTYRADITSIVSGNGNYVINNLPVTIGSNDTDGATLFIIYSDPSQNYTGSIVIADGCFVVPGGSGTATISGFNVCATPSLTTNFAIFSDLQRIANLPVQLNSNISNYTLLQSSQEAWNFIQDPGTPAVGGQNTAIYSSSNASDCYNFLLAGMYFRTNCNSCTASGLNVTTVSSPSCSVGSATAYVTGGSGSYSYTWAPTGGNSQTVNGVPSGIYTVTVQDTIGCVAGTTTVNIPSSTTVVCMSQTICAGNSATLSASGATSYTWSTGALTSNIIVNPSSSTNYTVSGSNGGCSDTKVVSVTVNLPPTIFATTSSTTICAGQTVTLSATGASSYTFNPGGITGNPIAVSPTISTTYTITGANGNGCTDTYTITQNVALCSGFHYLDKIAGIEIYPNPSKGEFILTLPNASENNVVEIYNGIGQLVKKQIVKEITNKIFINDQPDGVYYLRIQNENQVYKTRIVKE